MENKLNKLEAKKAEIEQAFAERQQYLKALDKDIELMEALYNAKAERARVVGECQGYREEYSKLCAEEMTLKVEAAKAEEELQGDVAAKE